MLTPDKIAELKSAHGPELAAVTGPTGVLVFKKPERAVYDKWLDHYNGEPLNRAATTRELAQNTLVFPDYAGFIAAIDREPALLMGEILGAITLLAGVRNDYEVKKL